MPTLSDTQLSTCAALAGHAAHRRDLHIPVVAVVHGFALDNLGILIGVTRAMLGRATVTFR